MKSFKSRDASTEVANRTVAHGGFMRHVSADSGIGGMSNSQWNQVNQWNGVHQPINMHAYHTVGPSVYAINPHQAAFNQNFLPMYSTDPYHNPHHAPSRPYTDIEIKSYRSDATSNRESCAAAYDCINLGTNNLDKIEEMCITGDGHPDTQAKLNEISRNIKSRNNSRAPSLAAQSRRTSLAGSRSQLNSEPGSSTEDTKTGIKTGIKPDDTDAELVKTHKAPAPFGKLETDDELEIRKKWHESRFIKNAKTQKSATPKQRFQRQKPENRREMEGVQADVETDNYNESRTNVIKGDSPCILKTAIPSVSNEMIPYWDSKAKEEESRSKPLRNRSLSTDFGMTGKRDMTLRDASR